MPRTTAEKRIKLDEHIRQLENERKQLIQQEKAEARKARTKRLIERGAIAESLVDNAVNLTNDEFKLFISNAVTALTLVNEPPSSEKSKVISGQSS